ncbi:interferon-induced very large GTPase 1-like [Anneissia japonica]|uniref:interferon-induced very large GTPase 1-like n=1 Tax=Anneissia japonica TaxID=1529436 RepID=UPI001425A8B3|nr:interferon-induced very large GTPase 1-like [Anneissia japonica]
MGHILSMLYNVLEYAVNAVSFWRPSELQCLIKDVGLDAVKWTKILREVLGVNDISQLKAITQNGAEIRKVFERADDYEVSGLHELLNIPQDEEQPITDSENKLCMRLKELGLNDRHWFNILKTKFAVSKMESIKHIGLDCLNELKHVCQTRNEIVQLQNLFGIHNEYPSFVLHFVNIRNRIRLVNECIKQIESFLTDGKTRSCKTVHVTEQSLREILQIPSANWIRPNTSLKKVLRDLSKLECYLEAQEPTYKLSLTSLIRTASSGSCLKGVLYTGNGIYAFPSDNLLKVPSKVVLNGPNLPNTDMVMSGSKDQVKSFIEHAHTYGYISGSVNLPSKKGKDISTVKMKQFPIASFTFRKDELRFSDSAQEHLKKINSMREVDEIRVMECCKEFLNTYGSHIFQGPIHFGGIQWITAETTQAVIGGDVGVQAINLQSIEAFKEAPFGRFAFNVEYDAGKIKGKIRSQYSRCVVLTTTASGGHRTFSYFPTWKLGMSADIKSWNVIDRGTEFPVAIWEILENSKIQNAKAIGHYLFKAWVDMSNVYHIFTISSELEALINEVHTYVTSLEDTDRQYLFLEKILDIKGKVIKCTRSIRAWSDIFIGSQDFDIIIFLKKFTKPTKQDTLAVIFKIINDNDMLNQPCVSNDKLNEYYKWQQLLKPTERNGRNTKDISEFSDFALLLEQAIWDLELNGHRHQTISNVASYLSRAVIRLVDVFYRQNRVSDAKLLFALVTPLGFHETIGFLSTKLTIEDVTNLEVTIKNNISIYAKLNDKQKISIFIISVFLEMILLNGDCNNLKHKLQNSTTYQDLPEKIRDKIDSLDNKDPENWREILLYIHQYYDQVSDHDQDMTLHNALYKATHSDKGRRGLKTSIPKAYELEPDCLNIFKLLGLKQYFPKKLSRQEALLVSQNVISRDHLRNSTNTSMYVLQSLMVCNYEGRSFEEKQRATNFSGRRKLSVLLNTPTVVEENSATNIQVNPADVLIALFMCADNFLRQVIMEKLTMCQFSVPLLLPIIIDGCQKCEMLLWATRTIKKQWKTCSGSSCERSMSMHPLSIVSALRIGKLGISKSNILNAVINDQKHGVFFHYGSNGGTIERTLSTGVLEMTWYLPTGRDQDKFPDALAMMNLRGNASELKHQTTFLKEVSFATIAFITSDVVDKQEVDLLESLYQQNGHLILVSEGTPGKHMKDLLLSLDRRYSDTYDQSKQVELIYTSRKNTLHVSREIVNSLNDMLSNGRCGVLKRSLDDCNVVARKIGFYVDEDTQECVDAKESAEETLKSLQYYTGHSSDADKKSKLLPLQMIAIKIAERKREQCQLKQKGNMVVEKYIAKIQLELNELRMEQKCYCETFSNLVEMFMKSFSYPPLKRKYFYCWVKIMADQCSINQLQPVREEYNSKWNQLCDALYTNKNQHTPETELLKRKLDELHQKLTDLSVGLEHFNREIGQIYEMILHFKLSPSSYSVQRFPNVVADMLLEGHPLELMDGDASDVPIAWIKNVMSCLQDRIGNKHLFVLSVLGVQSTGKSTMLNVMFGLQFAVSAGRCTKGVFVQLVQLHTDLQQSTKCDYIMVVDTEGLRAPELASIEHTNRVNEIATFVIGLGDATIINIMGENPSDMQDTLQIVVHALMKMETVKIKPSCLFVHQNVADVTASDRNTAQRRKMTRMLDEITKIAAKEENCSEKYEVFSDVINFQENKHVMYISSLWQGDPPMAPPNPGYSSCILQVREKVIDLMQNCDCQTISDFNHRLSDLWKAIISENFVFNFRNTLEIQAFNALETEFVEHSRTVRRDAMICVNELRIECNKLRPSVLKVDCEKILARHSTTLEKAIKTFENKMNNYFGCKPKARQWKRKTELRMNELCQDLRKSLKSELMAIKKKVIGRAKIDSDIKTYEKEILKKAKDLADELRRTTETDKNFTEEKLKREFDEKWFEWVSDIPNQDDRVNITSTFENIWQESFHASGNIVNEILRERTYVNDLAESDIELIKWRDYIPLIGCSIASCADIAYNNILSIKSDSERKIETFPSEGKTFTDEVGRVLFDFVLNRLNDVKKTQKYKFKKRGLIRNTIHILWYLFGQLNHLQETYRRETDLKRYMESQKDRLWQMFRDQVTIVKFSVFASNAVSRDLTNAIKTSLTQNCITGIIDHVRTSRSRTFANKMSYHAQILIDLADDKDFKAFRKYLADPSRFMEIMIGHNLREFCTTETEERETVFGRIYSKKVTELFSIARTAIHDTCRSFASTCTMGAWWSKLLKHIGNRLDLKPEIGFLNNDDLFDVKEMYANLLIEFKKSEEEMEEAVNFKLFTKLIEPCKQFFKRDLLGCLKLCPFCNAPCDLQSGDEYDDHRTEYHRPQGVAGYHWEFTKKLNVDVCTSSVMTENRFKNIDTEHKWHPYKEYQSVNEYYKAWKIQPIAAGSQLYWKWFMATYNEELAEYYDCKPGDIPDEWEQISWETAKADMIDTYNL